jgi:3',5'-cyclic AMP phosphodiesterase CpdA
VADINRQQPDAVIFTGDTVQHGRPEEYVRLRDLLEPLEAPLYPVPGNRDDNVAMRRAFDDHPNRQETGEFFHYTVDRHEIRLVAVDSTLPEERKGRFCETRQQWLDPALGEQPERPTLFFIHHPPFDVGDHYVGGYRQPTEAEALAAIVTRHPQVAGLICGHVHWPVEREWAGTEARIMPSVAVDLRKGIDEATAMGRPAYMLHRAGLKSGLVSELVMAR